MKTGRTVLIGVALAATVATSVTVPAYADSDTLSVLENTNRQADSPDTAILGDVADVATDTYGDAAINERIGGGVVKIPTDPSSGLSLQIPSSEHGVAITLPFSETAARADALAPGVVSYDNGNGTTTTPVVKADGSVQIATIIRDAGAPSQFAYIISSSQGSALEMQPEGSVLLKNTDGTLAAGIAAPWARDANGREVPTRFEVSGNTLTQVVDLSGSNIAYPVVADPAVSYVLLAGVWKNRAGSSSYKNSDTWSTRLSPWGVVVWTSGTVGNQTIRYQGWTEWVNGPGPTSTSVHQQYECHVLFGYDIYHAGVHWDFETARKSNPNWLFNPQKCNWA